MAIEQELTLNLKAESIRKIRQFLKAFLPQCEVWAYGSRVHGSHRPMSDVDLVVRNPSDLSAPVDDVDNLRAAFVESDIPQRVDVHDWAEIPEHFRAQILKGYVVVQEPDPHFAD